MWEFKNAFVGASRSLHQNTKLDLKLKTLHRGNLLFMANNVNNYSQLLQFYVYFYYSFGQLSETLLILHIVRRVI